MANRHPSAIKRNRQNEKKLARNTAIRSRVRNDIRKVREAVARQDIPAAEGQLRAAMREINKARSKGVMHPNAAARRIARLSKNISALRRVTG